MSYFFVVCCLLFVVNAELEVVICVLAIIQGFKDKGYTDEEIEAMLRRTIQIARKTRELYYKGCSECCFGDEAEGKILQQWPILIVVSVGSYEACLADESKYNRND